MVTSRDYWSTQGIFVLLRCFTQAESLLRVQGFKYDGPNDAGTMAHKGEPAFFYCFN